MQEKLQKLLQKYQTKLAEIESDLERDIEQDVYDTLAGQREAFEGFIADLKKILED